MLDGFVFEATFTKGKIMADARKKGGEGVVKVAKGGSQKKKSLPRRTGKRNRNGYASRQVTRTEMNKWRRVIRSNSPEDARGWSERHGYMSDLRQLEETNTKMAAKARKAVAT
ncbi:MAG: hypothetical protein Q8Q37_00785 [bacterium]|nr:hypothetical protein [bacterium]